MREILFRAWDKVSKKYREFDGMHDTMTINEDGKVEYYNLQNGSGGDEYILEQFTGLYAGVFNSLCGDKEYDEIYEGDKISVTYATQGMSNAHEHTITGVVAFKNGSFVVEWDFPKKGKYKYQTLNSVKTLGDWGVVIKIIGNIHDNQELLS